MLRNLFGKNPVKAINLGVTVLLQRLDRGEIPNSTFWQLHGSEKIRLFVNNADQLIPAGEEDVRAIDQFKQELSQVADVLEATPVDRMNASNPDCIRSLVFSQCNAYLAEVGFRTMAEMWETYVRVLQTRQLKPRTA